MKHAGRYQYVTDCIGAAGADVRALIDDTEVAVSLETFRKAVGLRQWREIQAMLGYSRSFPIGKDWHVDYCRGVYRGVPAYFLRHSGIEHIFTLEGRQGPSLATRENPRPRAAKGRMGYRPNP